MRFKNTIPFVSFDSIEQLGEIQSDVIDIVIIPTYLRLYGQIRPSGLKNKHRFYFNRLNGNGVVYGPCLEFPSRIYRFLFRLYAGFNSILFFGR